MKIALIYLRIVKRAAGAFPMVKNYEESTQRFLETYTKHKPRLEHDLIVVNCGAYKPDSLLDSIASDYTTAIGTGFDCGTYQEVNCILLKYDFVVAMNTHVYFWRGDWLDKLAGAAKFFGPGFYGPSASFECNPHLRTPCICYHPGLMAGYPIYPTNREECATCESGPMNFGLWAHKRGFPSMLVTVDGQCWTLPDWRKPPNIFRRGDQSNVLVFDRHIDVYKEAPAEVQRGFERQADIGQ